MPKEPSRLSNRSSPLQLAVLISGGGTTLRNLLLRIDQGRLDAQVRLVISSSSTAGGLQFAEAAAIEHRVVRRDSGIDDDAYCESMFQPCREAGIELVVMGGFLKHVLIPADFANRVINIHPSLIPAFCGKGFYGQRVHEAVLDYGAKISGCTVHFVDNQYDHGPIIAQRVVDVRDDDTPAELAARIFAAECEVYPEVIQAVAAGRLCVDDRKVRWSNRPPERTSPASPSESRERPSLGEGEGQGEGPARKD